MKLLFYVGFILLAITGIAEAQLCSGVWTLQRPLPQQCVVGQWIGWQNSGMPAGCPVNPIYTGTETNTFIFTNPVSGFEIDFNGFDGVGQCATIQIAVNGIFFHLTNANFFDFMPGSTCTGSFSIMTVTTDGYITGTGASGNGQGRIIINGVNATSVSVSTNDGLGTVFSNPFDCSDVVPLKLENFTGIGRECKILLNWKTGTEQNVKNIEIEKSNDGRSFYKIGEIIPMGSGSHYSFITTNFTDAYFRLKINDLDGYYEYSNTLSIKPDCSTKTYQILPNPASSSIEITGLERSDKIIVFDMLGKIVLAYNSDSNNKFDIHELASGIYVVQVIHNGIIKSNLKFIKN